MSIRSLLALMLFVWALPAAGIIVYSGYKLRAEEIRDARVETQRLADAIASEQQNQVAAAQQLLSALAQLPDIKSLRAAKVQSLLSNILKLNSQYSNLFIADLSGNVWASAIPSKSLVNIADRRYFITALKSGQFSSGEYVVGRATAKPAISFGYPVKNDKGKAVGVIGVGFDLNYYRQLLGSLKLPAGTSYALIDHKGTILGRAIDQEQYIGKQDSPERMKQLYDGPESATFVGPGLDGVKRFTSYRKIRLKTEQVPYMYVRAGIPYKVALAASNKNITQNMGLFSLFLVLTFVLTWAIAKRAIVDRVTLLNKASMQIADGDLDTKVAHLVEGGELGALGRAFDDMAERLAYDIVERKQAADEFRTVIKTTLDGFNICDKTGRILKVNNSYCSMIGYTGAELLNMSVTDIEAVEQPEMIAAHIDRIIKEGSDRFETKLRCKDGRVLDVEVNTTYLAERGGRLYSFVRDITERRLMERELLRSATYDRLTGVLNRHTIEDRITAEIERFNRYGTSCSLIMLDIDDFKNINDTFGHLVGDDVLSSIAGVLGQNIRTLDSLGRWGGEEFMILLSGTGQQDATSVAEKLRKVIEQHVIGEEVRVTASFGVTESREDDSLDTMMRRVDDLLYTSKGSGKNRVATG
jgi:diguanylate cyclase (GGDEF)-like protein/PAS domain S-box-containing protein